MGDPTLPVDSSLGIELLLVNAELMEGWQEIRRGRAYGLPTVHHEQEFEDLAARQRGLIQALRDRNAGPSA